MSVSAFTRLTQGVDSNGVPVVTPALGTAADAPNSIQVSTFWLAEIITKLGSLPLASVGMD